MKKWNVLALGLFALAACQGGDDTSPYVDVGEGGEGSSAGSDVSGGSTGGGGVAGTTSAAGMGNAPGQCLPGHQACIGVMGSIGCLETGTGSATLGGRCMSDADCMPGLFCGTGTDMTGLCTINCYASEYWAANGCNFSADCTMFGFARCFGSTMIGQCALTCAKDEDCPTGSGCLEKRAWTGYYDLSNMRQYETIGVCAAR